MNALIERLRSKWESQRRRAAFLALEDGSIFRGVAFGDRKDAPGEVIFNTGMTGYQEIVSDPSYAGQFVALTAAEIGNYGCNPQDDESRGLFFNGLVIHELNAASNWRAEEELDDCLKRRGRPGIWGVDTRALTLLLREKGSQKAWLHVSDDPMEPDEAVRRAREWQGVDGCDYASSVSIDESFEWNESGKFHVVAFDFGCKWNILRCMASAGMRVTVVPARTDADAVLAMKPDGVFLSNGPGDPSAVTYAIENVRKLLGRVPLMGICLGHQLLGLACGAECVRLKFGHHGCNHPVKDLRDGSTAITSQNHNYALAALPDELETTHVNLNDGTVEGVRHKTLPAFSVQFHPEAAPGPHDAQGLFQTFLQMMERAK